MEHRYAERFAVDLAVTLFQQNAPVATGTIKNGSGYGLFIQTDYQEIHLLQKLRVTVVLHPEPQRDARYEFECRVVRKTGTGLGLELETIGGEDSQVMKVLIDTIHGVKIKSPDRRLSYS